MDLPKIKTDESKTIKETRKNKRKMSAKIIAILVLTVFITSAVTYGYFAANKSQTGNNTLLTECFNIDMTNESASINLSNAYPISNKKGQETTPYSFTLTNTCATTAKYYIIVDSKTNSFDDRYLNVSVNKENPKNLSYIENTSYPADSGYQSSHIIETGTLVQNASKDFDVRIWIDEATTYEQLASHGWEGQVRIVSVVADIDKFNSPSGQTLAKLGVEVHENEPDFTKKAPLPISYTDGDFIDEEHSNELSSTEQEKYYTFSDSYSFNTETGTYTLVNPQTCKYSECYANLANKYIVSSYGSSSASLNDYIDKYYIYKVLPTSTLSILNYKWSNPIPNYDSSQDGVYVMEDDYGTSYYYRGAVTNNYVKFADKYWRILRVNGDGSLRIIYDGTSAHVNGDASEDRYIGKSKWNDIGDDAKYVGYMFGGANGEASTSKNQAQTNTTSSTIKTYLDTWYQENILASGNAKYISDTLFCNDRSTVETPSPYGSMMGDTGLGYGQETTVFGYWNRIAIDETFKIKNITPKLKCPQKNDAFTVDDTSNGNGNLIYPIGLITADEVSISGGVRGTINDTYYLYKGNYSYSLTPYGSDENSSITYLGEYGELAEAYVTNELYVIPVINLSSEFIDNMTGDGTMNNPYRLS